MTNQEAMVVSEAAYALGVTSKAVIGVARELGFHHLNRPSSMMTLNEYKAIRRELGK